MLSDYDIDTIQKYLRDFKSYRKDLDRFERKYGYQRDAVRNPFWMFECQPVRKRTTSTNDNVREEKREYVVHDIPFVREPKKEKKKKEYVVHDIPYVREEKKDEVYVVRDIPYVRQDIKKEQEKGDYFVNDSSFLSESKDESKDDEDVNSEYLQKIIDNAEKVNQNDISKTTDTVMISPLSTGGLTPLQSIKELREQRRKALEQQLGSESEEEKSFLERKKRRQQQLERYLGKSFEKIDALVEDLRKK